MLESPRKSQTAAIIKITIYCSQEHRRRAVLTTYQMFAQKMERRLFLRRHPDGSKGSFRRAMDTNI